MDRPPVKIWTDRQYKICTDHQYKIYTDRQYKMWTDRQYKIWRQTTSIRCGQTASEDMDRPPV